MPPSILNASLRTAGKRSAHLRTQASGKSPSAASTELRKPRLRAEPASPTLPSPMCLNMLRRFKYVDSEVASDSLIQFQDGLIWTLAILVFPLTETSLAQCGARAGLTGAMPSKPGRQLALFQFHGADVGFTRRNPFASAAISSISCLLSSKSKMSKLDSRCIRLAAFGIAATFGC